MGFLRSRIRLDEVDSTSSLARRLLAEGGASSLPLLIRADRQTAGRGRGDHTWWSDPGGLAFTLVLDPARHGLRKDQEPRLALVAALSLIDAIGPLPAGVEAGVRWPNDVEADGRKLAGLLPERVETADGPRLLLGVGVNVAGGLEAAPEAVRAMATTVERIRGGPAEPGALLSGFLDAFAVGLERLAGDDPSLAEEWDRRDLLRGRSVSIDLGAGRVVRGVGRGIDRLGGLMVQVAGEREPRPFYGGQVLR
ncbi:MAG: biotin--[acetyl-CoA-carboxylase] ligase [Isosphaeraceae bacterium]